MSFYTDEAKMRVETYRKKQEFNVKSGNIKNSVSVNMQKG